MQNNIPKIKLLAHFFFSHFNKSPPVSINLNKYPLSYNSNFDHILIMKPTIGSRATINKRKKGKRPSASRRFVEINTHHNITMKREFLYVEDVKEAININTLEERIRLKR